MWFKYRTLSHMWSLPFSVSLTFLLLFALFELQIKLFCICWNRNFNSFHTSVHWGFVLHVVLFADSSRDTGARILGVQPCLYHSTCGLHSLQISFCAPVFLWWMSSSKNYRIRWVNTCEVYSRPCADFSIFFPVISKVLRVNSLWK
jgi:hypothetical protein